MTAGRRWPRAVAALVVTVPLVAGVASPTSVSADSSTALVQGSLGDLVVDSANEHVFVSGGGGTSGIEVYSFSGAPVTMVQRQPGASGMVLSPDGTRLFVALFNGDAVSAIDTSTLAEVARWRTGVASAPERLAWAGNRLWVSYGTQESGGGALAPLDIRNPAAVLGAPLSAGFLMAPQVAGGGNVLVVFNPWANAVQPSTTFFDVGTTAPTVLGESVPGEICIDASITSDGQYVTYLCGDSNRRPQLRVVRSADLSVQPEYSTTGYAVAAGAGPGVLAAGTSLGDHDISVYKAGGNASVRTYSLDGDVLLPQGLAFSADGARLFAISQPAVGPFRLHVLPNPSLPPLRTSLSLTSSQPTYAYGATASVTAHLGPTNNSRVVNIYALPYHSTAGPVLLKSAAVDASGNLSASYKVTYRTTFTASFASDDRYASATVSRAVTVKARLAVTMMGFYGRSGKYLLYRPGTQPVMVVSALPMYSCIQIRVDRLRTGKWRSVVHTKGCAYVPTVFRLLDVDAVGPKFRIRPVVPGSAPTAGTKGTWQHFRFR